MNTDKWFRDLVACKKYLSFEDFQQRLRSFQEMWFTTFAEFEERLKEFESITGTQYNKLKGDKLRDDRPERQTLVYRRLTYACYHYGESRQNENSRNRTPKIGCTSVIVLRTENNILRIVRFDMRHCHAVGPEYAESSLKQSRKRLRPPDFDIAPATNPELPPSTASSRGSPLSPEEKLDILTPYLNLLADFVCSQDDLAFYRSLETIQSIYGDMRGRRPASGLVDSGTQPSSNVDFLGGRIDEVSPPPVFKNVTLYYEDTV